MVVTSGIFAALMAHAPLQKLRLPKARGISQRDVIEYLAARGHDLGELWLSDEFAARDASFFDALSACPHLFYVFLGAEPYWYELEKWPDAAKRRDMLVNVISPEMRSLGLDWFPSSHWTETWTDGWLVDGRARRRCTGKWMWADGDVTDADALDGASDRGLYAHSPSHTQNLKNIIMAECLSCLQRRRMVSPTRTTATATVFASFQTGRAFTTSESVQAVEGSASIRTESVSNVNGGKDIKSKGYDELAWCLGKWT
ncbi:hypothetical protein BDK51DRAFT_52409 [Blyttiomyces helicus]|uniref:Uncharacterized protein n=1 Tax=Blyttiomyces helicus TaxID=388810 RepID=A0A4P9W685_9FUNG|nr:hypothetical protein BDK51DRAFT_52409 [Blyttiomyces helicus]|eukprot:RKO86865.1 hypothetical protein BDK51DRAFT_52409 [Blyttiomyces helicus]